MIVLKSTKTKLGIYCERETWKDAKEDTKFILPRESFYYMLIILVWWFAMYQWFQNK